MAEVERLLPGEPTGDQSAHLDQLQQDHDRYLGMLGADHSIVVSLRKQIEAGTAPESPTAVAVKQAKTLLDLLVEHEPDELEQIQEARSALDKAKIANGSRESDCYQSAEAALKQAEDAVDALQAEIEETKIAFDAVKAKQQKQAVDLVAAIDTRDAAKKRVLDRVVSISTQAPGILQPADVLTMSTAMQQLDTLTRTVHQLGTQNGGVPMEAMQRVADQVAVLMRSAPDTVFSPTVTSEPAAYVANGIVVAGGGSSSSPPAAAQAASQMPGASTAALQAKFNARELERAAVETKAKNERAAEAAALRKAAAEEAAAAAATASVNRSFGVDGTAAVHRQPGTPMEESPPAGVSSG